MLVIETDQGLKQKKYNQNTLLESRGKALFDIVLGDDFVIGIFFPISNGLISLEITYIELFQGVQYILWVK